MRSHIQKLIIVFSLLLVSLSAYPASGAAPSEKETPITKYYATVPLAYSPYPTPVWINLDSSSVVSIVPDARIPGLIYAGTWGSGVVKSIDGCATWRVISSGLGSMYINIVALDPGNLNILYAGTYDHGIYKTVDGGSHWTAINTGIQNNTEVYGIAVDPATPTRVYIGTRADVAHVEAPPWKGYLYRTVDGGAHWTVALSNVGGADTQDWAYAIAINPAKGLQNMVLAATHEHGAYRSLDYGQTWQTANSGVTDLSARALVYDSRTSNPATIYMGTWHRSGVFKTITSGDAWTLLDNGSNEAKTFSMAIDALAPDNVYLATFSMGVVKTADGGKNWTKAGMAAYLIYAVAVNPFRSSDVYCGTVNNGVWRSLDGGKTWARSSSGLTTASVTGLTGVAGNSQWMAAGVYGGGVQVSRDGGATWQSLDLGASNSYVTALIADPNDPSMVFALTTGGLLHVNLNTGLASNAPAGLPTLAAVQSAGVGAAGQNLAASANLYLPQADLANPRAEWAALNFEEEPALTALSSLSAESAAGASVPALSMVFAPSQSTTAYLGTSGMGVYKSVDGGQTWQAAGLNGESITALSVDPLDAAHVAAAGSKAGAVWLSADGGASWAETQLPGGLAVYSLGYTGSGDALYAGTADGIFRFTGSGWVQSGLQGHNVTVLAAHPTRPKILYAGTENGVYLSYNGGVDWQPGLPQVEGLVIQSINFDPQSPDRVFYGLKDHGGLVGH